MSQESTMICIDNSEYMRNGDYAPNRMLCQEEAVSLIAQCKFRACAENAVGLISMAGTVKVLSTLTHSSGKFLSSLHFLEPKGEVRIINAIKVAELALRHRQNKNHKMRIVIFIGSPVEQIDETELMNLAKKLKKEKVQVDAICFGEANLGSRRIMEQFIETLNGTGGSGSNFVMVPSGQKITEALLKSPICGSENEAGAPAITTTGSSEFGFDPNEDPELAMALRLSLEEERQREQQQQQRQRQQEHQRKQQQTSSRANAGASELAVALPLDTATRAEIAVATVDPSTMTEEQQLEWALRLSMQGTTEDRHCEEEPSMPKQGLHKELSLSSDATARSSISDMLKVVTEKSSETQTDHSIEEDRQSDTMENPELHQLNVDMQHVDISSQVARGVVSNAASGIDKKNKGTKDSEANSD